MVRTTAISAAALAAGLATALPAGGARAQSLVEEVSGDACDQARAFAVDDTSPAAARARRGCRLQHFEIRLAAERRQAQAAELDAREARIQAWIEATQPVRVVRPMAIVGFLGSGLSSYGLAFSWDVLRRLELDARIGWRQMTCWNQFSASGADCTRRAIGGGVRWFISDNNFSPFFGAGFAVTTSHLQILSPQPQMDGGTGLLTGNGRANSVSPSAGVQISAKGLRMTLEYVYEYVYYTGANLDEAQTPSEDLRIVWRDSLRQDRHGVRFEVGYAF